MGESSVTYIELLSSITVCKPKLPINAEDVVTLKSPRSVVLDDQAERFPASNPSAKIRSATAVRLAVGVREGVAVGVEV